MFYDRFKALCDARGISCNRAALEIGLSNATPTKWKKTGAAPDSSTLTRVSEYFGVSVGYLMGTEPKEKAPVPPGDERAIGDDEIKFALFGGGGEITDAMYEEVKRFAHMVKLREEAEKKEG